MFGITDTILEYRGIQKSWTTADTIWIDPGYYRQLPNGLIVLVDNRKIELLLPLMQLLSYKEAEKLWKESRNG